MSKKKWTASDLYKTLLDIDWKIEKGRIEFKMADIRSTVKTTDIIGFVLQNWIKDFLNKNNVYYREPHNTQSFPDFYLCEKDNKNLLEIKSFIYDNGPAFDIANFESYCDSISNESFRLDADYLIFGYGIDENGLIEIKEIRLKKIWEIAGTSQRFPLKTQVKRDVIYNIRPNTDFKNNKKGPFSNENQFIEALYLTLLDYRGEEHATQWLIRSEQKIRDILSKFLD
ncbi:MAG: NgoBV family restriction endonuclease [Bacilli bacterium]|jgi:hypothetical protein|nr:NgoBV family restriction endonuclease [Bacilli bacterium]